MESPRAVLARRAAPLFILLAGAATSGSPCGAAPKDYVYLSPVPGSRWVSPHNNVVIRSATRLDRATLGPNMVSAVGSLSGVHAGTLALSDDAKTLIFVPSQPFATGERVSVELARGPRTESGRILPPVAFEFFVSGIDPSRRPAPLPLEEMGDPSAGASTEELEARAAALAGSRGKREAPRPTSVTPADYPPVWVINSSNPDPGAIFMTPNTTPWGNLVIIDDLGQPLFYRRNPGSVSDFKMQPNGLLSYFNTVPPKFYLMNAAYTVVDSFATGNGYVTDLHDLQLLDNGHALLMSYDPEPVRMDSVVAGGNPNAIVTGLIVQELDASKNVVFQWRSWDHYQITDASSCTVDLTASKVDYAHGNALELDHDGNILVSSRNMSEITKIDRQTGAIMWRLGLNAKNNQFSFVNDARGFSSQHDIRRLPNGNITLFDNGNCLDPQYSRAVEYALDESQKRATLVWEHRDTPDIYGRATGNVQRRANGSTMIDWGFASKVTDLHADGTKAMDIIFGIPNVITYRAFRFTWRNTLLVASADSLDFGTVSMGDSSTRSLSIRNDSNAGVTIKEFVSSSSVFVVRQTVPVTVAPGATLTVPVRYLPNHPVTNTMTLYVTAANDTELVATPVKLKGKGNGTVAVDESGRERFGVRDIAPTPSRGTARIRFALPAAAHVRITVTDVQGRTVAGLADGFYPAGVHTLRWDCKGVPAGLYYVCCEQRSGESSSRSLILLR